VIAWSQVAKVYRPNFQNKILEFSLIMKEQKLEIKDFLDKKFIEIKEEIDNTWMKDVWKNGSGLLAKLDSGKEK